VRSWPAVLGRGNDQGNDRTDLGGPRTMATFRSGSEDHSSHRLPSPDQDQATFRQESDAKASSCRPDVAGARTAPAPGPRTGAAGGLPWPPRPPHHHLVGPMATARPGGWVRPGLAAAGLTS
jgi:hypothetical protein